MTFAIDNLLIRTGVDASDLKEVKNRPLLYAGIIAASALTLTFFGLALTAWL